jgi:hypothetical protein
VGECFREEARHAPSCASFQRKPIARRVRESRYLGSSSTKNHPFCRNRLQKTTDLLRHRCRLLLVLGNGTRWTRRLAVALLPAVAWAPTAGAASKGAPAINDVGPLFSCVSSFAALRQCANHHSIESAPLHENLTDSPNGISGEGDRGERGVALARRARTPRRLPVPRTTAPAEARPF